MRPIGTNFFRDLQSGRCRAIPEKNLPKIGICASVKPVPVLLFFVLLRNRIGKKSSHLGVRMLDTGGAIGQRKCSLHTFLNVWCIFALFSLPDGWRNEPPFRRRNQIKPRIE